MNETTPQNAKGIHDDKAEKMRQIKASIASANQGVYKDSPASSVASQGQRYVQRKNAPQMPYNNGTVRGRADAPQNSAPQPPPPISNTTRIGVRSQKKTPEYVPPRYNTVAETTANNNRKAFLRKLLGIGGTAVVAVLMISYLVGYFKYRNTLLPNTFVNDIDVSKLSLNDAHNALVNSAEEIGLTFRKKTGEEIHFSGKEFGSTITVDENALQGPSSESHVLWFTKLFKKSDYSATVMNSYSESELSNLILTYNWGSTPPTDAYLQKGSDGSYSIIPEDDGDMVDSAILAEYTLDQVAQGNTTIDLAVADCYLEANIKTKDLEPALEACNTLSNLTITYDFEDRQEELDTSTIAEMISTDFEGNVTVDENKARSWVIDHLVQYDTFVPGYTRTFNSTLQGTIQVSLGDYGIYGWQTDVDATVQELIDYILAGESVTVDPVYSRTAASRATDDIGSNYIELDITNQHVWVYQSGVCVLDSDCVTGTQTDPERLTPPGVYRVWSMERDRILGTYEVQGYEAPVAYWMNFTEIGIGFHDLARSAYGGDIYMYNGSHGCVNLPLDVAERMFNIIDIGWPVIAIP